MCRAPSGIAGAYRGVPGARLAGVLALKALFWLTLGGAPLDTVLYPLGAAALARVRTRAVRKAEIELTVTVIVAAYNEERVIERRLENLLALDYPADRLEIVVASDASTDRTHEMVERFGDRGAPDRQPRGGKTRHRTGPCARRRRDPRLLRRERDMGSGRHPGARRELRRPGRRLRRRAARARGGRRLQPRGVLRRYEMVQRQAESRLARSPAATARSTRAAIGLRRGRSEMGRRRRPLPDGAGRPPRRPRTRRTSIQKPTPSTKPVPAQGAHVEHCWEITLRGSMLKRLPFGYLVAVISHRILRYGSGVLHLVLLAMSALVGRARLPGRARCAARADRGHAARCRDCPLLRPRHLGNRGRALELFASRRARDVGGCGGDEIGELGRGGKP